MLKDAQTQLRLAKRIRQIRLGKGLTQAQLAGLLGTKQSSIARLEKGDVEKPITFGMLDRLALVLGEESLRPRIEL